MAHQTAARKSESNHATVRALLSQWQALNSRQHVLLEEMTDVELQLAKHIDLMKPVEADRVRGTFADVCLDINAVPQNRAAWLAQTMSAAGL
jgi:hypothetical protein